MGTLGNSGVPWGAPGNFFFLLLLLFCLLLPFLPPQEKIISHSFFFFLPLPSPPSFPSPSPPSPLKGLLPLPYPSSSFFFLPFFFLPLPSLRPPLRPKIEQGPQKRIPPPEGHRWRYQNAPKLRLKLIQDSSSVPKLIRNCPKFDLKMSKGPPKKPPPKCCIHSITMSFHIVCK